jgi:two-component system, LytTR family, response regulator AlgR
MTSPARKLVIIDDEAPARERLGRIVAELDDWTVAGTGGSGLEAIELVKSERPAVVLLDIRMPGMSGIEAARHLSTLDQPPAVVFTSAYDEYALQAFESRAIGYLLKPVRKERLVDALAHAARLTDPALRELGTHEPEFARRTHIAARVRGELQLIPVASISFFQAGQKYVTVSHGDREDLIEESLKSLEEEFAPSFVRAHRNLLVAVAQVEALERNADGTYALRLRGGGRRHKVSRRQVTELKARLVKAR